MQNFVIPVIPISTVDSSNTVPIGSIIAYLSGYFTATDNVGYNAISQTLSSNWQICDGSEITDTSSPFYSASPKHYLPRLNDNRFFMSYTAPLDGDILYGGNTGNTYTLINPSEILTNLPQHTHSLSGHNHTWSASVGAIDHSLNHYHNYTVYVYNVLGPSVPQLLYSDGSQGTYWYPTEAALSTHVHTITGTNAVPAVSSGNYPSVAATAFSILPKYLTATYIIRVK